jgi:hypothetical protein
MLHGKQAPTKPKHRRKALPVLGAAGLSLSLAGATTAAAIGGPATDTLTRNAGVSHEINPSEEEIADVSLATFYVVDTEGAAPSGRGARLAMGSGGCGGCGGCGGARRTATPRRRRPGAMPAPFRSTPRAKPYERASAHRVNHTGKLTSDAPIRARRDRRLRAVRCIARTAVHAGDGARGSLRNASTPRAAKHVTLTLNFKLAI